MPKPQPGQLIVDVGCGDGSAFPLYQQVGLQARGVEISDEIVAQISTRFVNNGIKGQIETGSCSSIPFASGMFDYAVAWNSCYYMSTGTGKFEDHVSEISRVLKSEGWLICSIPTEYCFIFDDITYLDDRRYVRIDREFFGLRGGEVMRYFAGTSEIEMEFSAYFENFSHATIDIDWFGLRYAWHVFTAKKRNQ
jgi:SAM-dependent methyltransferase